MGRLFSHPNYKDVELNKARWPNFSAAELACFEGNHPNRVPCRYCGGEYFHNPVFLDKLQAFRNGLGKPVIINSGHRCRKSELRVGGVMGEHRRVAADIITQGHDRQNMILEARKVGFTGVGLYKTFIHLDTGPVRQWFGRGAKEVWSNV